jgi:hypothetical protein
MKVVDADVDALAVLPIDTAGWLSVARAAKARGAADAPLAFTLAQVASEKLAAEDADAKQAITLFTHELARQAGREDLARQARGELIAHALVTPRFRAAAIEYFTQAQDEGAVADICKTGIDIGNAWACAKGSPKNLMAYVPTIAELPVLGAGDATALLALDKDHRLDALGCISAPGRPEPERIVRGLPRMPAPAELKLYYRMHEVVGREAGTCLLEQVAAACLSQLRRGVECSVPFVFADYMRRLEPREQDVMISVLFGRKTRLYGLLRNRTNAAYALFHLHLVLAELLLPRPTNELDKTFAYHLERAYGFRDRIDPKIRFKDLLSPALLAALCGPVPAGCATQCQNATCLALCEKAAGDIMSPVCSP